MSEMLVYPRITLLWMAALVCNILIATLSIFSTSEACTGVDDPDFMKSQLTRSQNTVLKLLKQLNREISAQELYIELRKAKLSLGLATVYRALEALKLNAAIQARLLSNGETLYSTTQQDRHHMTCLQCGTSIPIQDEECPVHELEDQLRQTGKFEIYYHTLEFFGLCSPCQLEQHSNA